MGTTIRLRSQLSRIPLECELTETMEEAMNAWPKVDAVLVKRHGCMSGVTISVGQKQAECLDYLFKYANRMRALGLDPAGPEER